MACVAEALSGAPRAEFDFRFVMTLYQRKNRRSVVTSSPWWSYRVGRKDLHFLTLTPGQSVIIKASRHDRDVYHPPVFAMADNALPNG